MQDEVLSCLHLTLQKDDRKAGRPLPSSDSHATTKARTLAE